MKMYDFKKIITKITIVATAMAMIMLGNPMPVQADVSGNSSVSGNGGGSSSSIGSLGSAGGFNASYLTSNHTSTTELINDSDRSAAYGYLIEYKNRLINSNNLDQETKNKLDEVWAGANSYIANSGNNITVARLVAYVN
jgi:hypothetical protein